MGSAGQFTLAFCSLSANEGYKGKSMVVIRPLEICRKSLLPGQGRRRGCGASRKAEIRAMCLQGSVGGSSKIFKVRCAWTLNEHLATGGGLWNFLDALLIFVMLGDAICALANVYMLGIDDGGPLSFVCLSR